MTQRIHPQPRGRDVAHGAHERKGDGGLGGGAYASTMHLALYAYDACPHCQRVYTAIEALGIEVEKRDVRDDPEHRRELVKAVGRGTVPVLRIEDDEGGVRWLPESRDIVAWLYEREGRTPPRGPGMNRIATFVMWGLLVVGLFFPEYQLPVFATALAIGAGRSIHNAWTTKAWTHVVIAGMFLFGVAAIALRFMGVADIPWWYGAYGLVAMLLLGWIVVRVRLARASRS